MAVIKKTLFPENLDKYNTFVIDTNVNSTYFNITELPDTFTGGKNAFLIAGSNELVADTIIKIEIKDAVGNIIYHEPGEGIVSSSINGESFVTEYYEGVSKVVAVYVYPDTTAYGPCTITILGELSSYYDSNGLLTPIPIDWQGTYNVKWQKSVNVNPTLANTTKIRFYRRPTVSITEIVSPIFRIESGSKVDSGINQSFADVKLSQLETFAGDVKRVKVFRTSEGDISDFDLIQDILIESKELLITTQLTASVIGNTGTFTSEILPLFWNTGSLTAQLTSSRVESGLKLNGSGLLKYSQSLNINASNTYELNLDAFYSSSTASNLGIYISGSDGGDVLISTLNGITPTKNLLDTVVSFKLDSDFQSGSLYFSQSQGEWHLGNISLRLSEDTAFSPDEISFITTMPTVIGNETYNFKFEFYDVNNNFVPVAVTQSAVFDGGTIVGPVDTNFIISASFASASNLISAVSASISGTMTTYSSSASSSILTLSSSVSTSVLLLTGSISTSLSSSFGFTSGSIFTLSGSVSSSQTALSASVSRSIYNSLTASFTKVQELADGNYSGSFIGGNIIYAPVIGGQLGYFSTLFKVGLSPNSIYLDARQTPRKIFIGGVVPAGDSESSGAYNNTNTTVYMDGTGKFSLGNKLSFDGSNLTVNGSITVTGGNAATSTDVSNAQSTAISTAAGDATTKANSAQATAISTAANDATTKANSAQTAAQLFATSAAGRAVDSGSAAASAAQTTAINQAKADASASVNLLANGNWTGGSGTFITATSISSPVIAGNGGYISGLFVVGNGGAITLDGINKKMYIGTGTHNNANTSFYVDNSGQFSLKDKLVWDGTTLNITGNLAVGSSVPNSVVTGLGALATANGVTTAQVSGLGALATLSTVTNTELAANAVTEGKIATDAVTSGKISANAIVADKIAANAIVADKIATNAITAGKIAAGSVTADKITVSELSALGATIGGWSISNTAISKTTGGQGTITLDSSNNRIVLSDTSNTRFEVNTSTNLTIPSTASDRKTLISNAGFLVARDDERYFRHITAGDTPIGGKSFVFNDTKGGFRTDILTFHTPVLSEDYLKFPTSSANLDNDSLLPYQIVSGVPNTAFPIWMPRTSEVLMYDRPGDPAGGYQAGDQLYNSNGLQTDGGTTIGGTTFRVHTGVPEHDTTFGHNTQPLRFRIDRYGNIQVPTLANGTVAAINGIGQLSSASDKNLKIDAGFIENGIDKVLALKPRYFYWKNDTVSPKKQLGFYAQEVNEVSEETANTPAEGGAWGIYDRGLIAILTKAIQELSEKVNELEAKISGSI